MKGRTTGRRLFASLLSAAWGITSDWASTIADLALRFSAEASLDLTAESVRAEIERAMAVLGAARDESGQADVQLGAPGDVGVPIPGGVNASVDEFGVALIPVIGPLTHYEADAPCGCTSYEAILRDIAAVRAGFAAGQVKATIGWFDTPGGQVDGNAAAGDAFASLREIMPTAAYVAAVSASAGYSLTAALGGSNDIVMGRQAIVGSIGVRMATGKRRQDGSVEFVSSQSPKKVTDPSSPEGAASRQQQVDDLASVMIADIAAHRALSAETVLERFGQGDVMVAQRAIVAGMADRIGTLETVRADMRKKTGNQSVTRPAAGGTHPSTETQMSTEKNTGGAPDAGAVITTTEQLAAAYPALVTSLRADAATAERSRVLGIVALAKGGDGKPSASRFEVVLQQAAQPDATAGDAAHAILAAQDAALGSDASRAKEHLTGLKEAEASLEKPAPTGGEDATGKPPALATFLGHLPRSMVKQPHTN
jgi:ClpP class serine protease